MNKRLEDVTREPPTRSLRAMGRTSFWWAGPRSQSGHEIIARALALGAVSPTTARRRAELTAGSNDDWSELIKWGYIREARSGYYFVNALDGSAHRSLLSWLPFRVTVIVVIGLIMLLLLSRAIRAGG